MLEMLSASESDPFKLANETVVRYVMAKALPLVMSSSLFFIAHVPPFGCCLALKLFNAASMQNCLNSTKFSSVSFPP